MEKRRLQFRLSIPTKIFLGFALIMGAFSFVLIYNSVRLARLYEEVRVINRGLLPLRLTLSEIEGDLRSYSLLLSEPDPVVLRRAIQASQTLFPFPRRINERLTSSAQTIDVLMARNLQALSEEGRFERLPSILEELDNRSEELIRQSESLIRALEDGENDVADEVRRQISDNLVQMQGTLASIARLTGRVVVDAVNWATQQERRNLVTVAVSTLGAMVIALLVMFWSARTLRPLTRLTEGVRKLTEGSYETVDVRARNEIGELAQEFNAMVGALKERDRKLREGGLALERAYEAAVQAERLAAIGRLTSQITHEIRNPLSSLGLNIELLEDELRKPQADFTEASSICRAITGEIDRLTSITDEYLRFARLPMPQKEPTDLNQLLDELVKFHRHELNRANVQVQLDLRDDLPVIHADSGQLRQAILNLVRNAQEAMPDGGLISLTTRREGTHLAITVSDEGNGIEPEAVNRVFDPFFSTKPHGTGLGLALTRQIAVQHDGGIVCHNRESGGTVFTLTLPIPKETNGSPVDCDSEEG